MRANLGLERAPFRDDVASCPARDDANVRARLGVEPPEPEIGDCPRGGGDRRAPVLGRHSRVSRSPVEAEVERSSVRRPEHDLPDRRTLVVHEAGPRREPRLVERARSFEPDFLPRGEDELDTGVRATLAQDQPRRLEHDRDGRLVVRAEDGPTRVPHDSVLDHGLEGPVERHGVRVRAEEDRSAGTVRARDPAVEVPGG